tara:strand:- start:160 stop:441 length:282 start_codon:yes stop_codon:yes gene_type:complete
MKNIIIITFSFLFFSCNSSNKEVGSWTEEEKDTLFSECIKYATETEKMNIKKANDYCYCSLEIIIENFDNKVIADEKISNDNRLRSLWKACSN